MIGYHNELFVDKSSLNVAKSSFIKQKVDISAANDYVVVFVCLVGVFIFFFFLFQATLAHCFCLWRIIEINLYKQWYVKLMQCVKCSAEYALFITQFTRTYMCIYLSIFIHYTYGLHTMHRHRLFVCLFTVQLQYTNSYTHHAIERWN